MPSPKFPCPIQLQTGTIISEQTLRALHGGSGNRELSISRCFESACFQHRECFMSLVILSVQPACASQGKQCQSTTAGLSHSLLKHLVCLAGWVAQDWGQHGDCLALVSAHFVSWSAWAVLQHTFPSLMSCPGTSDMPQPAVKAAGFLPPARSARGGTAHVPRWQHSWPLQVPWSAARAQTAACAYPAGKQQAREMRFFLLFNLTVSWYYSGNYTSVSLCKLFLLSLVFPLAKN